MLKRVHDYFLTLLVIVLYCDTSFCVNIISEDLTFNEKVTEWINKVSLLSDENLTEIIETPYDNVEKEDSSNYEQKVDNILEHRQKRQANNGYQSLYPQVPYNPYQTQPSYNPGAMQTNGQQPHQGNVNNYHSGYPSTQPGYPSAPSNYPNQGSNAGYNHYPGNQNFKPSGPYPQTSPYQPGYGQNTGTSQQSFNSNNYPGYPNTSGNKNPVIPFNSTSSLPPNSYNPNYPSQWPGATTPSYNSFPGTRPSYNNFPPSNTPTQRHPLLPKRPGVDDSFGVVPPSHYPTINNLPAVTKNGTGFKLPNQNSAINPGQYPNSMFNSNNTQTGIMNRPNYGNSYVPGQFPINPSNPSNTYHPSIPKYPPNNYNNQGTNYYNNGPNASYDPRKFQK